MDPTATRQQQAAAWLLEHRSLTYIGEQWGISRERVRQLCVKWKLWPGVETVRQTRNLQLYQEWCAGHRTFAQVPHRTRRWLRANGYPIAPVKAERPPCGAIRAYRRPWNCRCVACRNANAAHYRELHFRETGLIRVPRGPNRREPS